MGYQEMRNNKKILNKIPHDVVQVKNPKTDRYVKIDRTAGKIIGYKPTKGPYKNAYIIK